MDIYFEVTKDLRCDDNWCDLPAWDKSFLIQNSYKKIDNIRSIPDTVVFHAYLEGKLSIKAHKFILLEMVKFANFQKVDS